jgi:hypothetical protein
MTNLKNFVIDFNSIQKEINTIADSEKSYLVTAPEEYLCVPEKYSEYGLCTLGQLIGFPANFIEKVNTTNKDLAREIIADRMKLYFKNDKNFVVREFNEKISGVVSKNYTFFDDKQVAEILQASPLAKKPFAYSCVTPERLHLRAIDSENPFTIGTDKSPLFFCYFVDNSMVGQSAFKVTLGIYRLACTNGMLVQRNKFSICKQIHRGTKDIAAEFNNALAVIDSKREEIKDMLIKLSNEPAQISKLDESVAKAYLAKALILSKKETNKVLELYHNTYGGKSKWDMTNAITEFARDVNSIERRTQLEAKALIVA